MIVEKQIFYYYPHYCSMYLYGVINTLPTLQEPFRIVYLSGSPSQITGANPVEDLLPSLDYSLAGYALDEYNYSPNGCVNYHVWKDIEPFEFYKEDVEEVEMSMVSVETVGLSQDFNKAARLTNVYGIKLDFGLVPTQTAIIVDSTQPTGYYLGIYHKYYLNAFTKESYSSPNKIKSQISIKDKGNYLYFPLMQGILGIKPFEKTNIVWELDGTVANMTLSDGYTGEFNNSCLGYQTSGVYLGGCHPEYTGVPYKNIMYSTNSFPLSTVGQLKIYQDGELALTTSVDNGSNMCDCGMTRLSHKIRLSS